MIPYFQSTNTKAVRPWMRVWKQARPQDYNGLMPIVAYFQISTIHLGVFNINAWSFFAALGFTAGIWWVLRRAKRFQLDPDKILNLNIILVIAALIGARAVYILAHLDEFQNDYLEIFRTYNGGLGFLGGFLLAIAVGVIYAKVKKWNPWRLADLFVPAIALGYFIGRVGCFLIHDHIGRPTTMPWGIRIAGQTYHETSIYTGLSALAIFLILTFLEKKKPLPDGVLFIIFLLWYSFWRFWIEFTQIGPYFYGLTYNQLAAVLIFVGAATLFIIRTRQDSR